MGRQIRSARRFDGLSLPPELARMHHLLRVAQTVPAPSDPALRDALEMLTGQRNTDPTAMLEYFQPSKAWLDEQNKGLCEHSNITKKK